MFNKKCVCVAGIFGWWYDFSENEKAAVIGGPLLFIIIIVITCCWFCGCCSGCCRVQKTRSFRLNFALFIIVFKSRSRHNYV